MISVASIGTICLVSGGFGREGCLATFSLVCEGKKPGSSVKFPFTCKKETGSREDIQANI